MSFAELTRNSFHSGVSPQKWVGLCRFFISKSPAGHNSDNAESALSNSVLVLYRSYPGDPALQDYLKAAIQDGILSISVFVATFLQAAHSPDLHTPATLDMLCRVALDAHYSSGRSPVGSVVSYTESPIDILRIVQDALALLRTAYSLPTSHFHQLTTSASELVILLLSCVTDMSQVSNAQAMVHFADANDLLHRLDLSSDVRQVLETFVLTLSLLIGDDAKAAREAQMMHTYQLTVSKGETNGSSSETDIITFSLILQNFVTYRSCNFGAGDGLYPIAILVGLFRWSSWTPAVFYTQLFLSMFTCLSQCQPTDSKSVSLWKAFIVGSIPRLLVSFERAVQSEASTEADWRSAVQAAVLSLYRHSDLISQCDHITSSGSQGSMPEDFTNRKSCISDFIHNLFREGLIDQAVTTSLGTALLTDSMSRVHSEAQDQGMDVESYIGVKLGSDSNLVDASALLERIWQNPPSHAIFSEVVRKRFTALSSALDVESLSHLCKILCSHDHALDMMALHIKAADLVSQAILFIEEYDCETVGDPQTAVGHLGDVVLFTQLSISHLRLPRVLKYRDAVVRTDSLRSTDIVFSAENATSEDGTAFNSWFKALFDSNSEGIEDSVLRSTRPKTLLRISASLFSHAISACSAKRIDVDVLNNGVSYFLGPLLNWTLVGVIKALIQEIQQKGLSAPIHLEVLQTLLLHPACPRPVLHLCGTNTLRLFTNPSKHDYGSNFDAVSIRKIALQSLGLSDTATTQDPLSLGSQVSWTDQPYRAIRDAIATARAGKGPLLDVDQCLLYMSPSKFLQILWPELCVAASVGDVEVPRRVAVFTLTMPRASTAPPLLPIFMHTVLPSLIHAIDRQQPADQTVNIGLLVAVISSSLSATLQLEWAMHSVCDDQRYILGQSSAAMARKLANNLRSKRHGAGGVVAKRLSQSSTFVANFPMFKAEMSL